MTSKSWRFPFLLSGTVLLSQAFPLAAPVRDAATELWATGFSLQLSPLYVLFAPFFGLADRLTLLSFHQLLILIGVILIGGFIVLGLKRGIIFLASFVAFVAWAALMPRPSGRLVSSDPDTLLIDFHSHTNASHDGRPHFTPEANMRWHQRQGFQASFITDHNRIEGTQAAKALSNTGVRSLEGEEISLWKTHLVVLGNHEWIDNQPFDSDPAKVPLFIREMNQRKLPVIASLPEYWKHHWHGGVQRLIDAGINGFEIVNGAPKALDFSPDHRRRIVALCRMYNLFMTGVSDNHGYGQATAVWSAMRIPGWDKLSPDQLEAAIIKTLQTQRFAAVQVLERARYNPENVIQLLFSPLMNGLIYWRSLQPIEAVSWVSWIWLTFVILRGRKRRIHQPFKDNDGSSARTRRG
jgi:hypothetical protein